MKLVFNDAALRDLDDGYHFYEMQEPGAGQYFLDTVFQRVDSLRSYAGIHPKEMGAYKMLVGAFPFAVFYNLNDDIVEIDAILDVRMNPERIRKRLMP